VGSAVSRREPWANELTLACPPVSPREDLVSSKAPQSKGRVTPAV